MSGQCVPGIAFADRPRVCRNQRATVPDLDLQARYVPGGPAHRLAHQNGPGCRVTVGVHRDEAVTRPHRARAARRPGATQMAGAGPADAAFLDQVRAASGDIPNAGAHLGASLVGDVVAPARSACWLRRLPRSPGTRAPPGSSSRGRRRRSLDTGLPIGVIDPVEARNSKPSVAGKRRHLRPPRSHPRPISGGEDDGGVVE